jgi:N-acylglucosamine 2-epimerase
MRAELEKYAGRYRRELLESVLPFWLRHAPDREHGGYFTCLDREGRLYDRRKYVWLNGRAAWTFARLYRELEPRDEWLAFSRSCVEFLDRHAFDARGRAYFSLTAEGHPAFFQRKPYSAVFVALGFLEYARATGELAYREKGIALFRRIVDWVQHPDALGRPLYGARPMSQLADIMVIALLALEIAAVDPAPEFTAWLDWSVEAVRAHYDPARRILLENAAPWDATFRDTPEGRFFCSGSAVEVGWFLLHVLEQRPNAEVERLLLDAMEGSLESGWDREYGGLFYFQDVDGRPMLPLEWDMKLWWPHTEAIYASILAYTKTRDAKWLRWLERLDEYAFAHYSDPQFGEWFGYADRTGRLTHTLKGNHYKGSFHVPRFLLFSVQRMAAATR